MRLDTKLKKILAKPDSNAKCIELIIFCMQAPTQCELWSKAHAEFERLYPIYHKTTKAGE